jgi:hypothetical protein
MSRLILFRMTSVSDSGFTGTQNTHFMFNNCFLLKSCYLRNNLEKYIQPDRPQVTIRRKRIAY